MIDWTPKSLDDVKLKSCENIMKQEKAETPKVSTLPSSVVKKNNENVTKSFFGSSKPASEPKNTSPIKPKVEVKSSKVEAEISPIAKKGRKRAVLFESSDEEKESESNVLVEDSIIDEEKEDVNISDEDSSSVKPKKRMRKSEIKKQSSSKRKKPLVEEEDEEEVKPELKPKLTTSMINSQNKNNKKRKLVNQTTKDDDGFLITEKVWVTDSDDNNETDEPKIPEVQKEAPKKDEPMKSKYNNDKSKPKQKNLMDFFKKN